MQSRKSTQASPTRRTSFPVSLNNRRISDPALTSNIPEFSSANLIAPPTSSAASASAAASAAADVATPTTTEVFYKPPLLMTPVSQIVKGPRRNSRPEMITGDRSVIFDPDQYNPDGSLKTVHKLPGFDQSYAQAMKARYVRHKVLSDREKELSVNEIFGRSDKK
ncbi:hypothetical protein BsWGS_23706 [Bradybaena similaris]